jgi:hypothetical protein
MNRELVAAIRQRISLGHTEEEIRNEVLSTGHTEEAFSAAYQAAVAINKAVGVSFAPTSTDHYARSRDTTGVKTLISYQALFSAALRLAWQEQALLLKGIAVTILFIILIALAGFGAGLATPDRLSEISDGLIWVGAVGFSVLLIGFVVLIQMVMMRALIKRQSSETFTSHILWSLRQTIGLSVVSFLVIALILAGYVFFIVPGIILSVYLFFSLFFYLDGKGGSTESLVMSTAHTYGRFWAICGRIIVLSIGISVFAQVALLFSAMTYFLAPLFAILTVAVSYYLQYCGYIVLYESVVATGTAKPLPMAEATLRTIYSTVGMIGLLLLLGLVLWFMND